MKKVIVFGSTGNLGKEIVRQLVRQGFAVTAVVRNEATARRYFHDTVTYITADVCAPASLHSILHGQEIVISALGKSVSPLDKSRPTFNEVDFTGNMNILNEAKRSAVKKFIYISAFHAERYPHLNYFNVHHDVSEQVKSSGIDFSIIKPPALFSAFIDMMGMAKKGQLVTIGSGDHLTNPINEGDLAVITVDSIQRSNCTIEAGGKTIYSRKELNEIVQRNVDPNKAVRSVPSGFFRLLLPMMKLFSRNSYDKFAFFLEVTQHDTIAPCYGTAIFEEYVRAKAQEL
ncbi:MAG: SDR family oxidoreductase [Bacteroidota bacterium]